MLFGLSHGKDDDPQFGCGIRGIKVMVSSCSELSTGLWAKVPAMPSLAVQDGKSLAFTCSCAGVPSAAKGLSVRAFSDTAMFWDWAVGLTSSA